MAGYSHEKKTKREYTAMQKELLDRLWEFDGDAVKAARAVGYARPYEAVAALKEEIIELAEEALARLAPKAVKGLENTLDADKPIPAGADKLKAIQLILERTNPKTDKVEVSSEKGSIFILPNKKPLDEPN